VEKRDNILQVRKEEMNENEPLLRCRNGKDVVRNTLLERKWISVTVTRVTGYMPTGI
jgi:hypothetical protein